MDYGTQHGDAMRDPEMVFWTNNLDGSWLPVSYRQDYLGLYRPCCTQDWRGRGARRPLASVRGADIKTVHEQAIQPGLGMYTFVAQCAGRCAG